MVYADRLKRIKRSEVENREERNRCIWVREPRAWRWGRVFFAFFSVVIGPSTLLGTFAIAAPINSVSYAQFEVIVKRCVEKIPDLQELWQSQKHAEKRVYFGGGALRGLLRWIEQELAKGRPRDLCRNVAPRVDELLILKNSDRDLFLVHESKEKDDWTPVEEQYRSFVPDAYRDWDILNETFYQDSLRAGGATIEKVRVAPDEISDPAGGLRDFYDGKLRFLNAPEKVFSSFRGYSESQVSLNSKTALILRLLRFSFDLPSLEIEPQSLKVMKAQVAFEDQHSYISAENYWITKALWKLYQSSGYDAARTRDILARVGLLIPLGRQNYFLKRADGTIEPLVYPDDVGIDEYALANGLVIDLWLQSELPKDKPRVLDEIWLKYPQKAIYGLKWYLNRPDIDSLIRKELDLHFEKTIEILGPQVKDLKSHPQFASWVEQAMNSNLRKVIEHVLSRGNDLKSHPQFASWVDRALNQDLHGTIRFVLLQVKDLKSHPQFASWVDRALEQDSHWTIDFVLSQVKDLKSHPRFQSWIEKAMALDGYKTAQEVLPLVKKLKAYPKDVTFEEWQKKLLKKVKSTNSSYCKDLLKPLSRS